MRPRPAFALLLLFLPTATADVRISGFALDLPGSTGDEAVEVQNPGPGEIHLDDVSLDDGEGRIGFPPGVRLGPGQRLRVALNASAYEAADRRAPDLALDAGPEANRLRVLDAGFDLAQKGDGLVLRRGDRAIDAVAWGEGQATGWSGAALDLRGDLFLRWFPRTATVDSDTAADWASIQKRHLGWRDPSSFPPVLVQGTGTAYTAPDHSRDVVRSIVIKAETSLRINVYEFRDVGLATDLLERLRARPALNLTLLVDESPVGQDAEEKAVAHRILQELADAGAHVRLLRHDRYAYDHAKYVIADDRWVLVQSENFVYSGLSPDGRTGNRGWGVLIDDRELASHLASVFDRDAALDPFGARVLGPAEDAPVPLPAFVPTTTRPVLPTTSASGFTARILAGPEANLGPHDALLEALDGAQREIRVEQLRLPPTWKQAGVAEGPNLYLEALVRAAERGVDIKILLDGHFLDDEDDDNAATARALAKRVGGRTLEVRVMPEAERVLHVKGWLVDDRWALVGSMNGNLASVAQNREVGVLLDAPVLAALYEQAFDADWARAGGPQGPGLPVPAGSGGTVLILAALVALAVPRRR